VTILFTDLVGSTALSQDVGDTAADHVRRENLDVLRQAIGRTGGTEVKSIGDALMVSYPAAADSIADAVAMQQGVDLHNRRCDGARLAMRVGISAGDASFEDGDWFGTPVVEASKLCTAAEGAGTMVSSWVVSRVSGADAGPKRSGALLGWSAGRSHTPSRSHSHVVRRMPHSCVGRQGNKTFRLGCPPPESTTERIMRPRRFRNYWSP
jgi:class 3 adenylate cyclase